MEKDTLHGFRIRMALFAQAVNGMIAEQLAEEGQDDVLEAQTQIINLPNQNNKLLSFD